MSFIIRFGYITSKWGELHGFYDKYGFGTLFFSFFLHLVADADGDITYQKKEWDDDGYGYSYWEWSEESKKAWMRPHFGDDGKMYFYIIGQKRNKMMKGIYAFYHSELSRFLLTQFDTYIEEIAISGSLMEGDLAGNN